MSETGSRTGDPVRCWWVRGWDWWTNCATHGWSGAIDERKRVHSRLVCPRSPLFPVALQPAEASDD